MLKTPVETETGHQKLRVPMRKSASDEEQAAAKRGLSETDEDGGRRDHKVHRGLRVQGRC